MDLKALLPNSEPGQDDNEVLVISPLGKVVAALAQQGFAKGRAERVRGGLYCLGVEVQMNKGEDKLTVYSTGYLTAVRAMVKETQEQKDRKEAQKQKQSLTACLRRLALYANGATTNSTMRGDQADPGVESEMEGEGPRPSHTLFAQNPGSGAMNPDPSDGALEELDVLEEPEETDAATDSPPMFNLSQPPAGALGG